MKYLSLRINAKVGERMTAHAKELQWSSNQFAQKAIETVCDMIEKPESRNLPDFIAMLDTLHAQQQSPVPLKKPKPSK